MNVLNSLQSRTSKVSLAALCVLLSNVGPAVAVATAAPATRRWPERATLDATAAERATLDATAAERAALDAIAAERAALDAIAAERAALDAIAAEPEQERPRPPQVALDACRNRSEGDSCSLEFRGQKLTGTCRKLPDGQDLACLPEGPPPGAPHSAPSS
jgi:hypothetical protein